MNIIEEQFLVYNVLYCKSDEEYFIDAFSFQILTKKEMKNKGLRTDLFTKIDIHFLSLQYAESFAKEIKNKELSAILSEHDHSKFLNLINSLNLLEKYADFVYENRELLYKFCKENNYELNLDLFFVNNYKEGKWKFNRLVEHLSLLNKYFSEEDVKARADFIELEDLYEILNKLQKEKMHKLYLFMFNLIRNNYDLSYRGDKYVEYAKCAYFETIKDKLVVPGKKNSRRFCLHFYGFGKDIMKMIQTEFAKETVKVKFTATDNPFGFAFGLDVSLKKKEVNDYIDFIYKNSEFINRVRSRGKEELFVYFVIETSFYPQNEIETVGINKELIEVCYKNKIEIRVENVLGD